jgi:hypothetical protein
VRWQHGGAATQEGSALGAHQDTSRPREDRVRGMQCHAIGLRDHVRTREKNETKQPRPVMPRTMPSLARRLTECAPMGPSWPQVDTTTLASRTAGGK